MWCVVTIVLYKLGKVDALCYYNLCLIKADKFKTNNKTGYTMYRDKLHVVLMNL